MTFLVKVTQEHIRQGERQSATGCPVALAISEQLGLRKVVVHGYHVLLGKFHGNFALPESVTDWIKSFDRGETVGPISFQLEARP